MNTNRTILNRLVFFLIMLAVATSVVGSLQSCGLFSDPNDPTSAPVPTPAPPVAESTNPIDLYKAAGGNIIYLHQIDAPAGNTLTTIIPQVEGSAFVMYMPGCKLIQDLAPYVLDPIEQAYWLSQFVKIDVDLSTVNCSNYSTCKPVWPVVMEGTLADAPFTCN